MRAFGIHSTIRHVVIGDAPDILPNIRSLWSLGGSVRTDRERRERRERSVDDREEGEESRRRTEERGPPEERLRRTEERLPPTPSTSYQPKTSCTTS